MFRKQNNCGLAINCSLLAVPRLPFVLIKTFSGLIIDGNLLPVVPLSSELYDVCLIDWPGRTLCKLIRFGRLLGISRRRSSEKWRRSETGYVRGKLADCAAVEEDPVPKNDWAMYKTSPNLDPNSRRTQQNLSSLSHVYNRNGTQPNVTLNCVEWLYESNF